MAAKKSNKKDGLAKGQSKTEIRSMEQKELDEAKK